MLRDRRKKITALFFLIIFSAQLFYPLTVHALTSGPVQPEMAKFAPAGASDLVDLFSGDLKYNIPLMDVGGYPINLAYNSGTGIEDEATWVGTGWTLNPGAVNRTMRGLPDDFDGSKGETADKITKEYTQKDFKKVGGRITVKGSLIGKEIGGLNAGVSVDLYKDNYWGIGTSIGVNAGLSLSGGSGSPLTAGLNVGVNSDTRNGVDVSPSLSIEASFNASKDVNLSAGLSGGFTYNTRAGLKEVSLGTSFSASVQFNEIGKYGFTLDNSAVKYFGQSFTPTLNNSRTNSGSTFSFDIGGQWKVIGIGAGGAGYSYKEIIVDKVISAPAFGYLNYLQGRKNDNALLDFNREKDGVFVESTPALATPVATHDFFLATGQTGSQQFRPHFGGNYMVNDRKFTSLSNNTTTGITLNIGDLLKVGGAFFHLTGTDETKKWTDGNSYNTQQEAAFTHDLTPLSEPIYFKQVGEMTQVDKTYQQDHIGFETEKIQTSSTSTPSSYIKRGTTNNSRPTIELQKTGRERKVAPFSYLNAKDASKYALDKLIDGHTRVNDYRKPHHISEITVTDEGGKRMIYGIPVYNKLQQDVSFSINNPDNSIVEKAKRSGLVSYNSTQASMGNKDGRLNIFSKETTPPYATSYLLTAVLSSDYVDKTGDGITDDDLGTAIKLDYQPIATEYQWRAPYQLNTANYNEGFNSDKKDDKASYVYGKKEIWYLDSIKSKTMIAVFYRSDREDALGVNGPNGGQNVNLKLQKLDSIRLYTKADLYKNRNAAVAVKVVHFEYDYSLYKGVSNNSGTPVNKKNEVLTNPLDINDATKNINISKGKLTLKKVYFTFGDNSRGESNPYEFEYDLRPVNDGTNSLPAHQITNDPDHTFDKEATDAYTERQTDRWGTYKQSWYNHLYETPTLLYTQTYKVTNSEFPYSLQKNYIPGIPSHVVSSADWQNLIDRMASKWQLNKITTPTGGVITAEYESDDYAYVQDRKAMQMCFVRGITTDGVHTGLPGSYTLVIELPRRITEGSSQIEKNKIFRDLYLRQPDGRLLNKIFFKINADIDNKGHYEYINGYAEIDANQSTVTMAGDLAFLVLKPLSGRNPIAKAAWQMLKTDLPQFAYSSYDNTDVGDGTAAIRSIIAAIGNLRELTQSFDSRAMEKKFADKIDLSKSMVRLNCPGTNTVKFAKTGGGSRVKKVQISDEWSDMVSGAKTAKYGQLYDYTLHDDNNDIPTSSGVASYEPQIGNEENPFHEPVDFIEKVHWSSDKYHFIEKPFCETYFPAASVGYSKVTVTSFGDDHANGAPLNNSTGYITNEFYTAKDFPTDVDYLPLNPEIYESKLSIQLFTSHYVKRVRTTQGFKIELNDMHGKPRLVKVFNKGGDMLSSTEYTYNVEDEDAERKKLNNTVEGLEKDGKIKPIQISTDVDFITDQRQSKSESHGKRVAPYVGIFNVPFPPFILPFFWLNISSSETIKNFYSLSAVKVIHRFGIVKKITTTQNGSTIEAENLLWDAETGQVLLTKTQNEFNKYTYSFSYPAYRAYEGMGGAYHNLGANFTNLTTDANGKITSPSSEELQNIYLFPGDELIDVSSAGNKKVWVIRSLFDQKLHLIDENGDYVNTSSSYQILRSGRRNLQGAGVGAVVCMKDPRIINSNGDKVIDLSVDKKILDSKAAIFKEEWGGQVNSPYYSSDCSSGNESGRQILSDSLYIDSTANGMMMRTAPGASTNCTCDCLKGFFDYLIHTNKLFIQQSHNITVGQLIEQANAAGYGVGHCQILDMNTDQLFYALTSNPVGTIYTAKIGDCTVSIRSNTANAVSFYGLTSQTCTGAGTVIYNGNAQQAVTETFPLDCSIVTNPWTGVSIANSSKITAGEYQDRSVPSNQWFVFSTNFRIPGIAGIPSNAIINSANLYLYAHPDGFNSPLYPNAHTTITETNGINRIRINRTSAATINSACANTYYNGWKGGGTYLNITDHFQDVNVDLTYIVSTMVSSHQIWMGLNSDFTQNSEKKYATFCSQAYPDPSKRPKLQVTYSMPGSSPDQATLSIDDCTTCPTPVGRKINPYYTGVLGNWRPYISYVYTVSREQKPGNPNQLGGTDIRNSGAYTTYNPFWTFAPSSGTFVNTIPAGSDVPANDDRWVWNSKSVYYDQKGNEIESVDPLQRYGSALFGYQQSMATAVAANARHNEIAFDGFEDYDFNVNAGPVVPCPLRNHFDFGFFNDDGIWKTPVGEIISTRSHTGKYSYHINGTINIAKTPGSDQPPSGSILGWDNIGRYKLLSNELAAGFAPVPNRVYLLSFWVYDDHPAENKIQNLTVTINGVNQNVSSIVVPVVEKWKRLELKFTMPGSGNFSLEINGNNIEIDDFRILPNAGQMNSYVYDDVTMRLMAQLDENNFATLYEYDEEGTPVRVKKETERGIMTLKESRQFFRKRL